MEPPGLERLNKLKNLILDESYPSQNQRWLEIFGYLKMAESELAPHVKNRLLWIHEDSDTFHLCGMAFSDKEWLTTPVEVPQRAALEEGAARKEYQTRSFEGDMGVYRVKAAALGIADKPELDQEPTRAALELRAKLKEILTVQTRKREDKWLRMIKALYPELEPTSGVSEQDLSEMLNRLQLDFSQHGPQRADPKRQKLIEMLLQVVGVMATTNLGKAGELAMVVTNLCRCQPVYHGLKTRPGKKGNYLGAKHGPQR
jgi:hypothetical protein